MISKEKIFQVVEGNLDKKDQFIVEISVTGNKIFISVDSFSGIGLDDCVSIARNIEANFSRDVEDYELEVTSAGLTEPFKVVQQYHKNVGQTVDILLKDGQKTKGKLISTIEKGINIEIEKTIKSEHNKKKQIITEQQFIAFENIKSTKLVLKF